MNNNELATKIEQVVCNHIGIATEMLFERTKKGACVKARHLSIYILHNTYKFSISWLSSRYGIVTRHIFAASAQIKAYLKYDKTYRELYNEIVCDLDALTKL